MLTDNHTQVETEVIQQTSTSQPVKVPEYTSLAKKEAGEEEKTLEETIGDNIDLFKSVFADSSDEEEEVLGNTLPHFISIYRTV